VEDELLFRRDNRSLQPLEFGTNRFNVLPE
jgi:hypothetical protein